MTRCFVFKTPVPYPDAVAAMEERIVRIRDGRAENALWFLEHPDIYTAGINALPEELKEARFPVYKTNRGGKYTWHGAGQRVIYVMFDLKKAKMPPKTFVSLLENALSATLADVGVNAVSRPDRVGLWVVTPDGGEEKIAALGIRIRHGVSYHGISVNVCPDLSAFEGIIPCGLSRYGVTSLQKLGIETTGVGMLDRPFADHFSRLFRTKTFFADSP